MSKRVTKAQRILNDARERMRVAAENVQTAEGQLGIARAALSAHRTAYDALEKELQPAPRKIREKPSANPPAQEEPATGKEARCGVCYELANHSNHDLTYSSAHAFGSRFDSPKPVARAPRKSKPKSEGTSPAQSSGTVMENAGNAVHAANGGD